MKDPEFDDAKVLIDEFAAKLINLNDGQKIPSHWSIYLQASLASSVKKSMPGRKRDLEELRHVVKLIALEEMSLSDFDKRNYIKKLEEETGIGQRKLYRIRDQYEQYFTSVDLPEDARKAVLDGITDALAPSIQDLSD